jgi:hypothetical protein
MNEQEIYENLPRDPEQAFLHLERYYRERCEEQVGKAHNDENVGSFWAEYIGRVLAAIRELGLATQFNSERMPKVEEIDYSTYLNFGKEVEFYRTQLLIRHGRRLQGYSVALDPTIKKKIGHHLAKIREIVDKLDVDDDKREALYSKIEALQLEVDRDRTRLDAFADLVIEATGAVGDSIEQLDSIRKWLDSIARLLWGARTEENKKLPAPQERKQIEAPRAPLGRIRPQSSFAASVPTRDDVNDEIPF